MKYFMRLGTTMDDYSAIGLHVGQLPGYPASHGCIRLPEEIASAIFERVKRGTPVTIQD
jgi:lipoprotein-anchoring transpeptidase ErfK/SrfK